MVYKELSLDLHKKNKGKLSVKSDVKVESLEDLSVVYTPGVAEPCLKIKENKGAVYDYTIKSRSVAVITDGSAVLGLGNIGPKAALPVMEGKCCLFKEFANVDAYPICLDTQNVDKIVQTIKNIAPGFGGINLEDISAPRCFEIEKKLQDILDIPVFHDDQHGTAIVVAAAVTNAFRYLDKPLSEVKAVVNGAGAAGLAISKMLLNIGIQNITLVDKKGIITKESSWANKSQLEFVHQLDKETLEGNLESAIKNANLFVGVSAPNVLTQEMVKTMDKDSVIFAMANPVPEIMPDLALKAGAKIVGTGRSDFPNQINNVLVFPGFFKGLLESKAKKVTIDMKIKSVQALANVIPKNELSKENIIPNAFNKKIVQAISEAVKSVVDKE